MQLDSLIWETAGPRTHMPKIVNESLGGLQGRASGPLLWSVHGTVYHAKVQTGAEGRARPASPCIFKMEWAYHRLAPVLKTIFINMSYTCSLSLTLMALF